MVLITLFNENEPFECRPQEALDCFLRTQMDVRVREYFRSQDKLITSPWFDVGARAGEKIVDTDHVCAQTEKLLVKVRSKNAGHPCFTDARRHQPPGAQVASKIG